MTWLAPFTENQEENMFMLFQRTGFRWSPSALGLMVWAAGAHLGLAGEDPAPVPPVSFLKDVAPVLARDCVACHNPKKAESKYDLSTYTKLKQGGQQAEDTTLEPGKPDESRFIELIRHDGQPRMPYKQEPLPAKTVALLERWVAEGARYDGQNPDEDWVLLLHKSSAPPIPEVYKLPVAITALAYTPDGQAIATSGYHEVNVWKRSDGSLLRRLRGVEERVHDLTYSPDGRWLAIASGDPGWSGSAQLWSVGPDGEKHTRTLVEIPDSILAVAFSPDSKLVAAAGADRAIRIWNVDTGKLVNLIDDHADWVLDLAFSPDGTKIASASRDKSSKVFDVFKRDSLAAFTGHAETVYAVSFSPDGKLVVTGGGDNLVRIWDPSNDGKQIAVLSGFSGPVLQVRYAKDGQRILAGSTDRTLRVFESKATKHVLQGHRDWVYSLGLSPDGDTVVSGGWDGEVRFWNLADGKPLGTSIAAPGVKPSESNGQR